MTATSSPRQLALADIEDLRQYERGRDDFRRHVIEVKRRRRVSVGPLVTLVFENRDTIRFQIQEMARVEKMVSDEQIAAELAVYNPLIPAPGELSATLFVELTDEDSLHEWLPKLVGIERSLELRIGSGPQPAVIGSVPEAAHAQQLTREDVTASVHYVRFAVGATGADAFATGPVVLASVHPAYEEQSSLPDEVRAELATDLRP